MDEAEENHVKHWGHVKLQVNDSMGYTANPVSEVC